MPALFSVCVHAAERKTEEDSALELFLFVIVLAKAVSPLFEMSEGMGDCQMTEGAKFLHQRKGQKQQSETVLQWQPRVKLEHEFESLKQEKGTYYMPSATEACEQPCSLRH